MVPSSNSITLIISLLDLNATNASEATTTEETEAPNPSQQEFLQLRDELIKEFKEFLPHFQKYVFVNNFLIIDSFSRNQKHILFVKAVIII